MENPNGKENSIMLTHGFIDDHIDAHHIDAQALTLP